jgi:hypothetical protein
VFARIHAAHTLFALARHLVELLIYLFYARVVPIQAIVTEYTVSRNRLENLLRRKNRHRAGA